MTRCLPFVLLLACDPGGRGNDDDDDDDRDDDAVLGLLVVADSSHATADLTAALVAAEIPSRLDGEWRLGLTTTSVDYADGATAGVDPGEAGTLALLDGTVSSDDEAPAWEFRYGALCLAACWDESELPSDPDFSCTDPTAPVPAGGISSDYLDCVCGAGAWEDRCGSGVEAGLEATAQALCFGAAEPPPGCASYADAATGEETETLHASLLEHAAHDLLDGTDAVHVLVVTSEGDSSTRLRTGDADPAVYLELFSALGVEPVTTVIGPGWDAEAREGCLQSTTSWGVERYQAVADATGGEYLALASPADDCAEADVASLVAGWAAGLR